MIGYVALGSDLGDRGAALRSGLDAMSRSGIVVRAVSSVWETEPVDVPGSAGFLNMAAEIEVPDSTRPEGVLETLQRIERDLGRTRAGRSRSRELDLDLLVLGEHRRADERLTLPHPRMWSRRFVLAPLAEIAPTLREPGTGRTVAESLASLPDRPSARCIGTLAPRDPTPVYSRRL